MAIDLSSPLLIDSELELVLVLPYRLGVRAPLPGSTRAAKFPDIAARLNDRDKAFIWQAASLGNETGQEHTTTFVAARKKVVLQGETASDETEPDRLVTWIRDLPDVADLYDVRAAQQSIWYYDWGLGAVDIRVTLRIKTDAAGARPDGAFTQLLELGNEIAFHCRTKLAVFRDWSRVSAAMIAALEAQPFLPDAPDEARELSGRLRYYLVGLVVRGYETSDIDDSRVMRLSVDDVAVLADAFTGRSVQLAGSIQWPGVAAVAEGFGGVMAILDADDASALAVRARILWLWRLVTVYLANLDTMGRVLSHATLELFAEGHPERNPDRLIELRRDRLGLQALLQECTPLSVCGTALERRVYGGIWAAWEGDRLFADVSGHLDFIREYIREAVDALNARTQNRLGWILTILNVLTFAAAIATIITTYDWRNEEIYPTTRIVWIAVLTLLFGVFTLIVMLVDRLRRRPAA